LCPASDLGFRPPELAEVGILPSLLQGLSLRGFGKAKGLFVEQARFHQQGEGRGIAGVGRGNAKVGCDAAAVPYRGAVPVQEVVGLLDANTAGGVVAGNGQAYGGSVLVLKLLLDQGFPESSFSYQGGPVVVVQGACQDFTGGGRSLIQQDQQGPLFKQSFSLGVVVAAGLVFALGVGDQDPTGQEFVGQLHGGFQVASGIASQVQDKALNGALVLQGAQGLHAFPVGLCPEFVDADMGHAGCRPPGQVHAFEGNFVAGDHAVEDFVPGRSVQPQTDLGTTGSPQSFEYPFVGQALAGHRFVVDRNNAISRTNACGVAGPSG